MKKTTRILAAALAAVLLGACAGAGIPGVDDAELIAAAAREYQTLSQAQLADGGEAALLSDTSEAVARALSSDVLVASRALPGSLVEDLGNGRIRVTASWTDDDGLAVVSVIERDRKPTAWSADIVSTSGSETRTVGGVKLRDTTVTIAWKWDGAASAYFKYRLERSGERLLARPGDLGVSTIVEWDAAGALVSRTVSWVDLGAAGAPALRSLVYTPLLDLAGAPVLNDRGEAEYRMDFPGRQDGGFAVLVSRRAPRVVEWFRADESLALRVTHDPTPGIPGVAITREYYAAGDPTNPERTETGSLKLAMNEDGSLRVVRELGGRKVSICVAECEAGLSISRDGETWIVVENADGSLGLSGPGGACFQVSWAEDGSPSILAL